MPHWPIPHESACQKGNGGIGIQPCCKLGEADKITRPACDIRIETCAPRFSLTASSSCQLSRSKTLRKHSSVLRVSSFGIPFAQENALHKTLRIPFKNPFGIHLHGAYATLITQQGCFAPAICVRSYRPEPCTPFLRAVPMLRQRRFGPWLTGYALLYLLRPTCHPFPIWLPVRLLPLPGPNRCDSVRISSGNFPGSVEIRAAVRAIPKGSSCRPSSGPGLVFHARIYCPGAVPRSLRNSARSRALRLAVFATFGKLSLSGLRLLRDSDQRVCLLHDIRYI